MGDPVSRVIGFVDESASTSTVAASATALAQLLDARLDVVHVCGRSVHDANDSDPAVPQRLRHFGLGAEYRTIRGEPVAAMLEEMSAADVVFAVLGSRSIGSKPEPAGYVARALLERAPIPLLVMPPGVPPFPDRPPRLLLPLDGNTATSVAVEPVASVLADAGAEIVALHVFDSSTIPRFIGSSQDLSTLAREFRKRHISGRSHDCELRIGDPAEAIMDVADVRRSDGIIVAWRQDLSVGRAQVVLELLRRARRPLIFAPVRLR